jgi:hypothetical protein
VDPGLQIITSDGKFIGRVGPRSHYGNIRIAMSPHTIPCGWIARVQRDVILQKSYAQVMEAWGAEPGRIVTAGGRT